MFFDGFELEVVESGEVRIRVRHGGAGPAVVLLHGHPRTHTIWHRVAARLAGRLTVVCPDLRGYGGSTTLPDEPKHAQASKRAMASDVVGVMRLLGHQQFAVVGHDRGAAVAFRTAMDHPDAVSAVTCIGRAVPIVEAVDRLDLRFAREWWHWFFLAQTEKPAEDVIAAVGPERWYEINGPEVMGAEAYADVWAALHNPAVVHAMCEDYRAGLTVDLETDRADRDAGRRLMCPVQSLWAEDDDAGLFGPDPLIVWRGWAPDLRGVSLPSGHHVAEQAPDQTSQALIDFWTDIGWSD